MNILLLVSISLQYFIYIGCKCPLFMTPQTSTNDQAHTSKQSPSVAIRTRQRIKRRLSECTVPYKKRIDLFFKFS